MLGSIFKPAWQSKSANKRKQFIQELNDVSEDELSILKKIVLEDEDSEVRKLAVHKFNQASVVFELIKKITDGSTRDEAVHVFSKLTGAKSTLNEKEFRELIKSHPETTLSIAKTCPHANLRLELLETLSLEEQIDLLADIEYSDTRSVIAEKITSIELLEKARNKLKGKDKNAEKIIKNKLHDLHSAIKQEEENLEKAETLCDKMEYLAGHTGWRSEFAERYAQCNRQWSSLDFTPNEYLSQRYKSANEKVSLIVREQEKTSTATTSQESLVSELQAQSEKIALLAIEELISKHDVMRNSLNQSNEKWLHNLEIIKPEKIIWKQHEILYRSIDSTLNYIKNLQTIRNDYLALNEKSELLEIEKLNKKANSFIANLEWSKELIKLKTKEQAVAEISELKNLATTLRHNAKEELDKLHKRINRLQGSTKRGNLSQARRELSAVIKLAGDYTGKDKLSLDERLEKATEAVDKMADWKDYATAPKFIALCESMEALSPEALIKSNKANMHAGKLAAKISELQKNWKALGLSDSAEEHWERFSKAGDTAYAPCAKFFTQRQAIRKKNLEKRELLVEQMKNLVSATNWDDNAACKKTEIEMRKISEAWKKIKDVEPSPGTKQWKRLRKAKDSVYKKLDVVYASNLELKNELIANAKNLFESDVNENSLKKLQHIQGQWKQIGITKRKDDQKAWKEFKQVTDAVFEKIKDLRKEKRAVEDEQLKPYRDIVKAIRNLSRNAKNLADADSNFDKLQTEHNTLPPMPRGIPEKVVAGIKKDYQRACSDFSKTRERIVQNKKHKALDNLAKKANLCTEYEALPKNATAHDLEDLKSQIESLDISDNELRKRFTKRLELARESNRTQYTETRRLLCIDLEILLSKDSPAEDKSLRMQIQLERMQKGGFGQDRVDTAALIKKAKLDWYCLPGAEPAVQKKLDKRFNKVIPKP